MVFHRRNVRLHLSLSRLIAVPAVAIALISALAATGSPALAAPAHPAVAAQSCEYVVQPGDWLSRIAARYRVSWHYLAQINHLANPNLLYVGERLSVCGGTSVPPPAAPPKATPPPPASQSGSAADTYWAGEPCHSGDYVNGPVYMWKVPASCYAGVYWINARNYVARSGFGWCNWWPEVLHPQEPRILWGTRHSRPIPGAVVVFAPGEQGASSGGHYGEVVAILGGNWILISEMNNTWRGAGFARVNYRYVWEDGGVTYIY